jgi:hypothetical protein
VEELDVTAHDGSREEARRLEAGHSPDASASPWATAHNGFCLRAALQPETVQGERVLSTRDLHQLSSPREAEQSVKFQGRHVVRLGGVIDDVGPAAEAVEASAGKSCPDTKSPVVGVDSDARQVPTGGWRSLIAAAGIALNELGVPEANDARADERDDEVPLVVVQGVRAQALSRAGSDGGSQSTRG